MKHAVTSVLRTSLVILMLSFLTLQAQDLRFEDYFCDKVMRVDLYFTGDCSTEIVSLDEIIEEPYYAGSYDNLVDSMNLGAHLFEVRDSRSGRLIFSRGFSSIFKEWQTTAEARNGTMKSFPFTVRFPYPLEEITLTIYSRDSLNKFQPVFETTIDPDSRSIKRDSPRYRFKLRALMKNGDPHQKVDILVLPEGYTRRELRKFKKDMKSLFKIFFQTYPFSKYREEFNVWYLMVPSDESGVDNPVKGEYSVSFFNCSYNSFGSDRYVLTMDNKRLRDVAANAPYDQLYLILNSEKYGGGGIFNLYSVCYARDNQNGHEWWPGYVFVHEFGHAFAGLGDEYYTSSVAYSEFYKPGIEPWEPNITALLNPDSLKWRELVEPGTPIPTPWNKAVFDSIPRSKSALRDSLLRAEKYYGKVGAFEGAGYASRGLYRPCLDCRMFSKSLVDFDPVCSRAIIRMIRFYSSSKGSFDN